MSAAILDGKALAASRETWCQERVSKLKEADICPGLSVVLVGEDPASVVYVRSKEKACERVGIRSFSRHLSAEVSQIELEGVLKELAANPEVHGILLQLPLPGNLDPVSAISCIPPEKDVDGFTELSAGKLLNGAQGFRPCTPVGILELIRQSGIDMDGKHAVVVGRSVIVGKPCAMMLLEQNCTVTICHSHTKNLTEITRQADILVAATGQAHLITGDMVKPGAVVIDAGIARVNGKLTGDIEPESVKEVAGFLSPVPGGAGPMTISALLSNTIDAAERLAHGTA